VRCCTEKKAMGSRQQASDRTGCADTWLYPIIRNPKLVLSECEGSEILKLLEGVALWDG
jgi:hypothetical protein